MAKSLIRQRRERGAVCPVCHSPDYIKVESEFKLEFECGQCSHRWSAGRSGGVYSELLQPNHQPLEEEGK